VFAIAFCILASFASAAQPGAEVLQQYVDRPDDSYRWSVRQKTQLGQCEVIELTLTSQTWRKMLWKHRMFVVVPKGLPAETDAMLVIEGGSWKADDAEPLKAGAKPLPKEALLLAMYAQQMNCPIVVLLNVPRQPLFDGRKEDAIVALTFDEYLKTGDSDWPLLLPMVKSAVRAMDAVQAFAARDLKITINHFTVTGASKRGWTTWLTAAVDKRVRGLVPMVIDMLNVEAQFRHQLDAYGTFSERIHDYTDRDLPKRMSGEGGAALRRIVDPYSYREQVTQPKMLILGTNDGFWTVDSLNMYWDGLQGEKFVVYVPNADHDLSMDWQRVMSGLRALHRHAHGLEKLPPIRWKYDSGADPEVATLEIEPGAKDAKVFLWTADAASRDFRKAKWTSSLLPVNGAGIGTATLGMPKTGYRAMYAEVVYGSRLLPLHLSTTIKVRGPSKD
jgi:PhoPQ-activated pathogenicity-related protein